MKDIEWEQKELPWLLPCPTDFISKLQSLAEKPVNRVQSLKMLANHHLNLNQLTKLGNFVQKLSQKGEVLNPLIQFRLSILSNSTVDLLVPALSGASIRYGVVINSFIPSYNQVMQEVINPHSSLHTQEKDAVLLAIDYRGLPFTECKYGVPEDENLIVTKISEYIKTIQIYVKRYSEVPLIIQTIPRSSTNLFGSFNQMLPGTFGRIIDRVNIEIIRLVETSGDYLLDVSNIADRVGLDNWHNPKQWYLYQLSFDQKFVPLFVDYIARLIASILGLTRKCLVLDLDNTLWGGVIGDDGLEGIHLGQGDPIGESYIEIQKMALALRARGILLAVCSKNDEMNARLPFQQHPEMMLKESDISVFVANWEDKATNLEYIAKKLNIGIDSLVLLDDNPAERAQVREILPMVAVPELPCNPAYYPQTLLSAGYFEAVTFSTEDVRRACHYQENAKRSEFMEKSNDLTSYLEHLEMRVVITPFNQLGLSRIVQLINKSNQFNLTSRRYTENEIKSIMNHQQILTLQIKLADRFGDYGMISVVICKPIENKIWEIDTWLMSCRVLGRGVEQSILNELVKIAKTQNIDIIKGIFKPSGKNELVRFHFEKLGFTRTEIEGEDTHWVLNVCDYVGKKVAIDVSSFISKTDDIAYAF